MALAARHDGERLRASTEHPAGPTFEPEQHGHGLEADGMQISWPTGQDDRIAARRRRSKCTALVQPGPNGLRGHPLLRHITVTDFPPDADLPHHGQQHVVDSSGQAQHLDSLVESGSDAPGVQPFGIIQHPVDQFARRPVDVQESTDRSGGIAGDLTAGDAVAHQPDGLDFGWKVPAVPATAATHRRQSIAAFPGTQRRHRHAENARYFGDGHAALVRQIDFA